MTPDERNERLDGPVHTWFGLTYANYLALPRSLMQSMPVAWQERMVAVLEELHDAYAHIEHAEAYIVEPARESTYGYLDQDDLRRLGVHRSEENDGVRYFDARGHEHGEYDRVLVPADDPVPHYNRGRTFVAPREVA